MPVQEKRILKEFETLTAFDSESFNERQIADYLIQKLRDLGLEVEEDCANLILNKEGILEYPEKSAGNIYGILHGNKDKEGVLFVSHMDTVKPGKGKKVIFHEDGRITSDGTTVLGADDVGGLTAIIEALTVIKEENKEHADIEIIFPIAEEPYAQGSRVFDYSKVRAKQAYVFDLSGKIGTAALAAPSIISFKISIYGKSAHAGFCPQDGIHAISIAAKAMQKFKNGWVNDVTSLNFGTISGGTARNIVPDYVEISGEIRSLVHEDALRQMETVRETFENIVKEEGGTAYINSTTEFQAYRINEDEDVVKKYLKACSDVEIDSPELIQTFGGSDNNHLTEHGIRGIVAASAMQEVHTTKEYTTVEDLVKTAKLVLQLAL
jgi:tripeptide aminopeptidase